MTDGFTPGLIPERNFVLQRNKGVTQQLDMRMGIDVISDTIVIKLFS